MRLINVAVLGLVCLVGWLGSGKTQAVPVQGLYKGTVVVSDQESEARLQAFRSALKQVLVKVGGTSAVLSNEVISQNIEQAERYVERYSYTTSSAEPVSYTAIEVDFAPSAVNQLLKSADAPIWGLNRPALMFWLGVQSTSGRYIVSSGSSDDLVLGALAASAGERGLPVYLPSMDLQDQSAVSESDIWGLFADPLMAASARYNADAVAMARVSETAGGGVTAAWLLKLRDTQLQGKIEASGRAQAIKMLVDQFTDLLAERYAVKQSGQALAPLEVEISDINTFRSYAEVSRYLTSLAPVKSVVPLKIQGDIVRFKLGMEGSPDLLQEYVALDAWLQSRPGFVSGDDNADSRIYFRWTPGVAIENEQGAH
ncbi:MAG: DUF2066 domain-containing protein [Hahellaceae bacterium]|nr:DUF2066 domain-containing protein [Hahellaceae bacterium]